MNDMVGHPNGSHTYFSAPSIGSHATATQPSPRSSSLGAAICCRFGADVYTDT